ncbi:hypothetical protein V8J88_07820 [Massilia sp. W12]|uniref:hypothetical protein n=1 Tax=Massilia sp. W12 TaxID=3126507 RepID=UPI0030D61C5A
MSNLHASLETLRDALLAIKPAGDDGFEGLIASALANVSGLVFRLAKSGSQFGRDGITAPSHFAIAMEAKRYQDKLSLENLEGKVGIASHVLPGRIDLWILAASSPLGEGVHEKLKDHLENAGISFLALDWTPHPLPPLAVLLTLVRDQAIDWLSQYVLNSATTDFPAIFDDIAAHPAFPAQSAQLQQHINASNIGLDALRKHNFDWFNLCFAHQNASKSAFGQFITVANSVSPSLARTEILAALDSAANNMCAQVENPGLVAMLGKEGCGKTWAIASWLAHMAERPIIVFVAGWRADWLDHNNPCRSLAQLLAAQDGEQGEAAIAKWERRLKRWSCGEHAGKMRFVLVLDGLNEHSGKPWSSILQAMAPLVAKLGGCLLASCRPAYWEREIAGRLGNFPLQEVQIGDYSETELAQVLQRDGIALHDLSPKVREFVSNPRVCSVAIKLLPRLAHAKALTVERLLLEYWRARMEERGDLLQHSEAEFHGLLRRHAKAWLENPDTQFARGGWQKYSPAVGCKPGESLFNDLTEIEEGRFMQVSAEDECSYEFRQESLPFALALLMSHEIKTGKTDNPREHLQRMLEPIQAFDALGPALAAAVGIACLDKKYPQTARVALVEGALSLQNTSDEVLDTLSAYVPECPAAFFDAAELTGSTMRSDYLQDVLLEWRDDERLGVEIDTRLPKWLGRWTRKYYDQSLDVDIKRKEEYEDEVSDRLALLSPEEQIFLETHCSECNEEPAIRLPRLATLFMAGNTLSHHAVTLFAFELADTLAPSIYAPEDMMAWVVRLNPVDYAETETAVLECTKKICNNASDPFGQAAAYVLRLLGSMHCSEKAHAMYPQAPGGRWRRVEMYCNTNPYDPNTPIGTNLDAARSAANGVDCAKVWAFFGTGDDCHTLEEVTPALARFDAPAIVSALHSVLHNIPARIQMPLRQISWRLPALSPIFDEACIAIVLEAFERLLMQPNIVQERDYPWIANNFLFSLLPHLDAETQLGLLLRLPENAHPEIRLRAVFKRLSTERLEFHLNEALQQDSAAKLVRLLFFASAKPDTPNARIRTIVAEQINQADHTLAGCAALYADVAQDAELDRLIVESAKPQEIVEPKKNVVWWRENAIARAITRQKRTDRLQMIAPHLFFQVAIALGAETLQVMKMAIDRILRNLQQTNSLSEYDYVDMFVTYSHLGAEIQNGVGYAEPEVNSTGTPDELADLLSGKKQTLIQKQLSASLSKLNEELTKNGASELISYLSWHQAIQLAQSDPAQLSRWLDQILAIKETKILRQLYNFAMVLAGAYAMHDAQKTLTILTHLREIKPIISHYIGDERIPIYLQTLFKTARPDDFVTALNPLREQFFNNVFTDAELETAVIAADACGAGVWLDDYMQRLIDSQHPGQQARGLTIAGLRHNNAAAQAVLAQSWGHGFLGEVAEFARKQYQKHEWASHWFALAVAASDPLDFWRYGQLAQGIADRRYYNWLENWENNEMMQRFGSVLLEDVKKAAEKRSDKRKKTLFGLNAPSDDIRRLMQQTH